KTLRSTRMCFLLLFFKLSSAPEQQAIRWRKAQQHILARLIGRVAAAADDAQGDAVDVDDIVGLRPDEAPACHFALERVHASTRSACKLDMLGAEEQPRRRRLSVATAGASDDVANAFDADLEQARIGGTDDPGIEHVREPDELGDEIGLRSIV